MLLFCNSIEMMAAFFDGREKQFVVLKTLGSNKKTGQAENHKNSAATAALVSSYFNRNTFLTSCRLMATKNRKPIEATEIVVFDRIF